MRDGPALARKKKMGEVVKLTDNVGQGECLAEKVAIGPPVVMFEVVDQVVEQQLLLLFLLHFGANANVQVHHEGVDLARLPVLPQPARHVKQDGLSRIPIRKRKTKQQQQHRH